MVRYLQLLCCCLLWLPAGAQVKCFATVTLDRSEVYLQQPFKVTYTVMTTTWYTQPLQFDNLQVPGAFIIPFTDAQPGRFTSNGTEYAGIRFYYLVFPYKAGAFTVPPLTITAMTPPVGSATAQQVVIHTRPQPFVVKPVPKRFPAGQEWMVASEVRLGEHWSKPLQHLKVGDVVARTVTINASGTLPQFIPRLPAQKVSWAEIYPGNVTLKDTRNDYNANGMRTETTSWLLTQAGTFTLPGQTVSWWNPYANRLYSRSTPAQHITVADNPSLGMLTTRRDSLQQTAVPVPHARKGPLLLIGMVWYKAIAIAATILVALWVFFRLTVWGIRKIKQAIRRYRSSETCWFRRFEQAKDKVPEHLYSWWDRRHETPAVCTALAKENETAALRAWEQYKTAAYRQGNAGEAETKQLQQSMRQYRRHRRLVAHHKQSRPPWTH